MKTAELEAKIKKFILNNVVNELPGGVPKISEKNISFGVVDASRYEADVFCSILPEVQTLEEGYIDGVKIRSRFVITFLFKKKKYSELVNYMTEYADAFRVALVKDADFSGAVDDSELGNTNFYSDAGATFQTVTAAEIELDILSTENYD